MLDVHRSAVAQWEKVEGCTLPSVAHLVNAAMTMCVAFEWLATGRGKTDLNTEAADAGCGLDEFESQCIEAVRRVPKRRREAFCACCFN